MKILFMGSGTFGLPVLDAIHASKHPLAAVVTAVDKPQGRGRILTASPAKVWAEANGIPVFTPSKINAPESVAALKAFGADVFVVASYGALLSQEILAVPAKGCINVHPSLLPKYRGASPVVQALLDGEKRTGMTIMAMAAELDSGDVLLQEAVDIGEQEDARDLTARLAALGGRMTVEALDRLETGRAPRAPQDHSRATYCSKLKKDNARLDWSWTAERICNHVRALIVWPGSVTLWNGRSLKILRARADRNIERDDRGVERTADRPTRPGEVIEASGKGIRVQAGEGAVWLEKVQPEGARPMDHKDFLNGSSVKPGSLFL